MSDGGKLEFERDRMQALLERLERMASGDAETQLPLSPAGDELDAIAHAINVLADELRWTNARMSEAERRRATEALRAQERAERASEAKSVFLRTASHEIRTPIAAILGIADVLAHGGSSEEDHFDLIERLRANSRSLLSLVGNVLDLSRLDADKIALTLEPISVLELVRDVVRSLEGDARRKGIAMNIESEIDLGLTIESDRMRLRQILVNVVANAVKFTTRGAIIVSVRAGPPGDTRRVTIDVTDSGIGIDVAQRQVLFEPFGQADPSIARTHGGTGLGLALSSRLAQQLGGNLSLKWSEPGKGSTFRLNLSRTRVLGAPTVLLESAASHDRAPQPRGVLDGVRILLADDNQDLQLAIGRSLRLDGASITYASNGDQAVEMARSAAFDVILMDVLMPVMNGLQATRILRGEGYRVPIIAISADASPETRAAAIDAGCNAHLTKPFEPSDLTTSIRFVRRGELEASA